MNDLEIIDDPEPSGQRVDISEALRSWFDENREHARYLHTGWKQDDWTPVTAADLSEMFERER